MQYVNSVPKSSCAFPTAFFVLLFVFFFGTINCTASPDSTNLNPKSQLESSFDFHDRKQFALSANVNPFAFITDKIIGSLDINDSGRRSLDERAIESEKTEIAASPIFDEFDRWVESYKNNEFKTGDEKFKVGEKLAAERRKLLKRLIEIDPQAVLEKAISPALAKILPANISDKIEKQISARGDFMVYVVDEMNHATGELTGSRTERQVVIDGNTYKAVVYGRRAEMTTKMDIPLHGAIVGDTIVLDESPVRVINASERAARTGIDSTIGAKAIAAEIGEKVIVFDDEQRLNDFVADQVEWESTINPSRASKTEKNSDETAEAAASSWTEGPKTILFIRVDFSDKPGDPIDMYNVPLSAASAQNLINNTVNQFYINNSYNKTSLQATVTPVVRVSQPQSFYAQGNNYNLLMTDARTAARAAGYETNNYNLDIIAFSYTSSIGWAGLAGVGGKGNLLNGAFTLPVAGHELGHNYGLLHANLWRSSDGTAIGSGSNVEYGDCYDLMGACSSINQNSHFNSRYKRILDWLTDANVQTITSSGTYRITAQDAATPGGIRTLKINKDSTKNYWIEFRQSLSGNVSNGALIHWDYSSQNFRETQLLDMTPATTSIADAPLLIGQSFYDSVNQIRITIVGKGLTSPESLDVRVEFGSTTTPTTPAATPTPVNCAYFLSPTGQSFPSSGGNGFVTLIAPAGCGWTVNSSSPWISISAVNGTSGTGNVNFYVQPNSGAARTGSIIIGNQTFTVYQSGATVTAQKRSQFDFDGDNKSDLSIFRPAGAEWWYLKSSNGGNGAAQFGTDSDKMVPADYTGDGKTDIAFFRPSTGQWFVIRSEDGSFYGFPFGTDGDVPAPADYDGDGRADAAIFRPSNSTWYISKSSGGTTFLQFGESGDVPVVADYDGDNRADIAIYRPSLGQWWINRSSAGSMAVQFGSAADKPVQADFTGDGRADPAFFRPSTGEWYVLRSENQSYYAAPFGTNGDVPTPGDYDGDGRADLAVYRPSNSVWYIQRTSAGTLIQSFGRFGDKPVASAFAP